MDVFSHEGELVNIHTAFHQCLYQNVIDFDTSIFSESNQLPAHMLKLRSRLALQQYDQVLTEVRKTVSSSSSPAAANEYRAVEKCATYFKAQSLKQQAVADRTIAEISELSKGNEENAAVQILCATVLAAAGNLEEALAILIPHRSKIDAVALIVQLQLLLNRLDLAKEEVEKAKRWAQDNVVLNLAEAWVYLREGGDKYQSAYYVFEELASSSNTKTVNSLLGQAISEIHLGRLEEAEVSVNEAEKLSAGTETIKADVLANRVVLQTLAAKPTEEELAQLNGDVVLVKNLEEKRAEFKDLMSQFEPIFVSAS